MSKKHEQAFLMMVAQLEFGAMVGLGVLENPASKEKRREPQQAQLFIDQLEMLRDRTRGNLSEDEGKLLEDSLYRLRMAYVETAAEAADQARESKSGGERKAREASGEETATPAAPPPQAQPDGSTEPSEPGRKTSPGGV